MSNDIIFLGAGASASDGAPIQNQLFKSYFENDFEAIDDELVNFFNDFFGINPNESMDSIEFPTFEEVLGILEISLSRDESFKGYSFMPDNPKVQNIKEKIVFLIAKILKEKLQSNRRNHDALIHRLSSENKLNNTSFISLNYDILIDNTLTDIHDEYDLDYAVDFTNFEKHEDWHTPRDSRSVKLFKLHGSLNWVYCPTCISLTITPKQKSVSTMAEKPIPCTSCSTNMVPIIIPPTFFKVMSNTYLQRIWRLAEAELLKADNIIFCGYSFPDSDIHIKYLLKRVEINSGNTPNIYIVNNHDGKSETIKSEEESRYKRFFKESEKVHYLDLSFQDFCAGGLGLT